MEGKPLFEFGSVQLFWTDASKSTSSGANNIKVEPALEKVRLNNSEWAVVECSFDNSELKIMFTQVANSRL